MHTRPPPPPPKFSESRRRSVDDRTPRDPWHHSAAAAAPAARPLKMYVFSSLTFRKCTCFFRSPFENVCVFFAHLSKMYVFFSLTFQKCTCFFRSPLKIKTKSTTNHDRQRNGSGTLKISAAAGVGSRAGAGMRRAAIVEGPPIV